MTGGIWKMRAVGLSNDLRTNAWEVTPPCGHGPFKPQTTRLNVQYVKCPRCGVEAVTDYNAMKIEGCRG